MARRIKNQNNQSRDIRRRNPEVERPPEAHQAGRRRSAQKCVDVIGHRRRKDTMARLRTINEAYAHLKQQDPGTGITLHFLRCLAVRGEIPTVRAGRKYLLDIDALSEHLTKRAAAHDYDVHPGDRIRPIEEHRR